jgi:hypothetical protein
MRSLHNLAAFLFVSGLLVAQESQTPSPWLEQPPAWVSQERRDAWSAFVAAHGPHSARWNRASGTPSEVFGSGVVTALPGEGDVGMRRLVHEFLDAHANLVGRPGVQWGERYLRRVGPLHTAVLQQFHAGIPVVGGRADVRVHVRGKVSMFGAIAFEIADPDQVWPGIDPETAALVAHAELGLTDVEVRTFGLLPHPHQLVYYAEPTRPESQQARLCWEIVVDQLDAGVVGRAYVDARRPALVGYQSDLSFCSLGHSHVRGFHPGVRRAGEATLAPAACERAADAAALPGALATMATNVTGTVRAVVPVLDGPGDLSSPANRLSSLQLRTIQGIRVAIPSTGAFAFTDASGNFTIVHAGTTPVTVTASVQAGERFRGVISQGGATVTATGTATPGTPITLDLGAIATIQEHELGQTTVAYHLDAVSRYTETVLGPLPPRAFALLTSVSALQACNAFYSAHSNLITFFSSPTALGLTPNATDVPCKADVYTAYSNIIQHEWGHFVDDIFGGEGFFEGLSEGWGDIFAMYHRGTPLVNEGFYNSMAVPAHEWARSGQNTQQFRNWAAFGQTGCDYPGATTSRMHCQGESWMGFAWKVRENFIGSVGSGFANEFLSPADAIGHAEAIVLGSIVANAFDQNGAVLQVYLLDDDDGDLTNGAPHSMWMDMAAASHALTVPTSNNGVTGLFVIGDGCPGAPGLGIDMSPLRIGASVTVVGNAAPPLQPAFLALGLSRTSYLGVPLPLDLTPLGATNCRLLCSAEHVFAAATDAAGIALAGFVAPYDPSLAGSNLHAQWLFAAPNANPAGWVTSEGATAVWVR